MNSTSMIDAGREEAVYHAAGIEAMWAAHGDHRATRSLTDKEVELDTSGALLTESQWGGVVVMLLYEDNTDILGSVVALNRDWLWKVRRKGIEPFEVAISLRDKAM